MTDPVEQYLQGVSEETETKTVPVIEEPEEIEEPEVLPNETEKPKVEVPNISGELQAKIYCQMLDASLVASFTFAHKSKLKKKLGNVKEDVAFKKWEDLKEGIISKEELSEKDKQNILKVDAYVKNYKKLPLTDEEKEMFIESLSQIIAENDYKMPPWLGIAIVVFGAVFTRTMDLMFE